MKQQENHFYQSQFLLVSFLTSQSCLTQYSLCTGLMVLPTQLMERKTRETFLRYRVTTTSYSCQRRKQRAPRWKSMLLISWAVHQCCLLAFSWCGESSAVGCLFGHYFCPQPQEMFQIFNDIFLKGRFFNDYTHKCLLHYFIKQVTGTSLMKILFLLKN